MPAARASARRAPEPPIDLHERAGAARLVPLEPTMATPCHRSAPSKRSDHLAQPRVAGDTHRCRGAAPSRILLPQPAMGRTRRGARHGPRWRKIPAPPPSTSSWIRGLGRGGESGRMRARGPPRRGRVVYQVLCRCPVRPEKVRLARLDDDGIASLGEDAGQRQWAPPDTTSEASEHRGAGPGPGSPPCRVRSRWPRVGRWECALTGNLSRCAATSWMVRSVVGRGSDTSP